MQMPNRLCSRFWLFHAAMFVPVGLWNEQDLNVWKLPGIFDAFWFGTPKLFYVVVEDNA